MAARPQLQFSQVPGTAEVTILPQRQGCAVVFLLFWLTVWTGVGLLVIGAMVLGKMAPAPESAASGGSFSALLWPLGWALGVLFVGSQLLWLWRGREVLTVAAGELRIQRRGGLFNSDATYALPELYDLRVRDNKDPANQGRHRRDPGAVLFDYGFETIGVGDDLPEEEARRVVAYLRQHRVDAARR